MSREAKHRVLRRRLDRPRQIDDKDARYAVGGDLRLDGHPAPIDDDHVVRQILARTARLEPSFAWADVAAIVLFRETNILPDPGSRKDTCTHSIGVRLRAEAPGSPEDYERQLQRARTRTDLDEDEREMIADMKMIADMYPPVDAEVAVSAYVPVKGWTLRTERFEEALATFAPDLTIIELPPDEDPTDWLNDQDDLSWILKEADERQAGGPGSTAAG